MKFTLLCSPLHNSSSMWFLGDFLDIKFSLNSPRIEQLHLSNYHWFVITTGYGSRGRKGLEMRARDRRTQRLRNTGTAFVEAGNLEKSVSLEVPKYWTRLLTHPRGTRDQAISWCTCFFPPDQYLAHAPQHLLDKHISTKQDRKGKRSGKLSLFCNENPGDKQEKHRDTLKMRVPWELSEEQEMAQAEFAVSPILSSQKCLHWWWTRREDLVSMEVWIRTGPSWRWSGLQRSSWLGPSQRGEIVNDFCEGPELRKWSSEKKERDLPPLTLIEKEIPSSGSGREGEKKSLSPYHFIMN